MKIILAAALFGLAIPAMAADAVLDPLTVEATRAGNTLPFSAVRGEKLFRSKHTGAQEDSCTACHTDDARQRGQHAKTGKTIEPLAPVANAKRFTDPVKVEKWFRRNCKEVLARECTVQEKGDFVVYMHSLK